jgi:hypothetical protein
MEITGQIGSAAAAASAALRAVSSGFPQNMHPVDVLVPVAAAVVVMCSESTKVAIVVSGRIGASVAFGVPELQFENPTMLLLVPVPVHPDPPTQSVDAHAGAEEETACDPFVIVAVWMICVFHGLWKQLTWPWQFRVM